MATVVGIFEDHFKRGKKLPVVRPGTQVRRFTHVYDTVKACIFAWKKINVNITLLQASNLIALLNLQNYLKVKLGIYQ
jgi:UDP-glucose 4-epimerase